MTVPFESGFDRKMPSQAYDCDQEHEIQIGLICQPLTAPPKRSSGAKSFILPSFLMTSNTLLASATLTNDLLQDNFLPTVGILNIYRHAYDHHVQISKSMARFRTMRCTKFQPNFSFSQILFSAKFYFQANFIFSQVLS